MKALIINDWKIAKITVVKPDSMFGWLAGRYCSDKDTFSFKANDRYEFYTDPVNCGARVKAVWHLPNQDSLYIDYIYGISGAYLEYEKIKLIKVSADTMKWHVTVYGTIQSSTFEYTLVPSK